MEVESSDSSIKLAGAFISNFRKTLFLLITLVTKAKSSIPTLLPYLISQLPF